MNYKTETLNGAIKFSMLRSKVSFAIGVQSFLLDYVPENEEEFMFMADMLTKAVTKLNYDPAKWVVHHNGMQVVCDTVSDVMHATRDMRTEAEQLIAAQRLQAAIDAELADEAQKDAIVQAENRNNVLEEVAALWDTEQGKESHISKAIRALKKGAEIAKPE